MGGDLLPNLRARYPVLLGDPVIREIGCMPGWRALLDKLCQTLQGYLDAHHEVPALTVVRVKEKWGGLRVYYTGGDEVCRKMVDKAMEASLTICEVCGDSGELVGKRWFSVRCRAHAAWSTAPSWKNQRG